MSEKLYAFLLKLYPHHFRRTYGDEALRLVRDRARSEKGFLSGLRLWLDLLLDLAKSLPREYSNPPTTAIAAAHPLHGERSFQLLAQPSLNPTRLCLGGTLSAVLFWVCGFVVGTEGDFPHYFRLRFCRKGRRRTLWLRLGIPTKKNCLFEIQPPIWRPAAQPGIPSRPARTASA